MTIAILDDERFDAHRAVGAHPERPERLLAAREGLYAAIPKADRQPLGGRRATRVELERVHAPHYLDRLERDLAAGSGYLDPDTYFGPGSLEATLCAAGGVVDLVHQLRAREAHAGFALVRPPGHHATALSAMGFCIINHVAVGAAAAIAEGARRVAIVDWDVHHGNGTQAVFERDRSVLFISLHRWPFYPGTGAAHEVGVGQGQGQTINIALPGGSGTEAYAVAFSRVVIPILKELGPDLILVSAGFDAHARDPLGGMCLEAQSYGAMATAILDIGAPVGFVLEGGYDLAALEQSVAAVGRAALGERTDLPDTACPPGPQEAIERTQKALAPYWRSVPIDCPSMK